MQFHRSVARLELDYKALDMLSAGMRICLIVWLGVQAGKLACAEQFAILIFGAPAWLNYPIAAWHVPHVCVAFL